MLCLPRSFCGISYGAREEYRGSSILLGAIVLVAILGAVAKIFIVTIMLAPTAYVAYKGKMVPN